jgi:beta-lactam-binding protein with PASTA domain
VLRLVTMVKGMPVEEAERVLALDGFLAVREPVPSDEYPPGYVVGESPDAGLLAPAASTVVVHVSTGPSTAGVPDVLDRGTEEARQRIQAAGLVAKVVVQTEPKSTGAGARAGRVWKQTPQTGTRTNLGTTVTVYVNPG